MSEFFRNTLPAWQWGILALVPLAIVALYFLKLKRVPLEVPSTYLWKKSIEDLHVNSLWQRLRKSLLLLLQLLLIALAMLSLLRPGWEGSKLEGDRFIFLVDSSASMSATDVSSSGSRLDEAKRMTANLIDQMESSMTAMIISFSDRPQVVQEFTSNRRLLRERLAAIEPTARSTDLGGALELASGLANPSRITTEEDGLEVDVVEAQPAVAYIFSDGRFEDVKGFSLGNLTPVYVPIGTMEAANLAITAVATRRNEVRQEERQVYVQAVNFTDQPQTAVVKLTIDGQFLDAREVEIPAGESAGAVFSLGTVPSGELVARLEYELSDGESEDAMASDDVGYAALNEGGSGKALVITPGNTALEVALATERAARLAKIEIARPNVLAESRYQRAMATGEYDLVIFDQCVPEEMPRANTLLIGRLPPGDSWRGGADASASADADDNVVGPQIIDWNRSHPLLAHVELGSVDLVDTLVLDPPPASTVLIDSTAGTIAAIAARDSYQDVVLGYEIIGHDASGSTTVNTNWPLRRSFPTFWLNALEHLASSDRDAASNRGRPGRPIELRVRDAADEITVTDPSGVVTTIHRNEQDVVQFHDTNRLGVYQVRVGDRVVERFAVNLFDRAESNVQVRPTQDPESQSLRPADIRIGHVDVAASAGRAPSRKEAWKMLLVGALFVLMFEWYIYNRRVYI